MEHFLLLADQLLPLLQKSQVVDDNPCQRLRQIFELVPLLFPATSLDFAVGAVGHSGHSS